MCRLVAYLGTPTALEHLVFGGDHSLARQSWAPRELLSGSVNVDGWGVTWWPGSEGRPVRLARPEPIWHDPDLPGLLEGIESGSVLAALRNATPGLPVDRSAVLPFLRDGRSFVLNGYVPAFRGRHMRGLRGHLSDALYARLEGVSDAETLFHLVLTEMTGGTDPGAALLAMRDRVGARLAPRETAPLTIVMMERGVAWGLHTTLNGEVNSLYTIAGAEPASGGRIFASEPLTGSPGWSRIPDHSLFRATLEGEFSIEAL